MIKIGIVVEGKSECNFIKRVLCPYFINKGKNLLPITVVTSRDKRRGQVYKGGGSSFVKVKNDINKELKSCDFVSTMFDFYGLPKDTPGVKNVNKESSAYEQVALIENKIAGEINCDGKFIPYIQLHEFESLIFSNLDVLQEKYFECNIEPLRKCLKKIKNPELINNNPNTAPSKRIVNCIKSYDKATIGVTVLEEIGLEGLRCKCKHFDEWIGKLETL